MNRRVEENRIAFQIWAAVPPFEKYKIGAAAVQILETIQLDMQQFIIYERSATNIRDKSLAF